MNKKILSMALAIVVAAGSVISAQTPKTDKEKTEQTGKKGQRGQMPNLFEGIELTADQQKALNEMRETERANREKAMADRQAGKEINREEMQKRMEERENAIKQILTPEQYTKYQANAEAAKAQMQNRQRRGEGQRGQRPNRH